MGVKKEWVEREALYRVNARVKNNEANRFEHTDTDEQNRGGKSECKIKMVSWWLEFLTEIYSQEFKIFYFASLYMYI